METNDDSRRASLPAPWHLTGRGCILAMRFPLAYLRDDTRVPTPLRSSLRGSISWVMFVDYTTADCGPYRELLFIPGTCSFSQGRFLTISKIFVSTQLSVTHGRANWGIPKELCDFDVHRVGPDESVNLTQNGHRIAEVSYRAYGPRLPMILGLLPKRWLTLGQHFGTKEFTYSPQATGSFRFARVQHAWSQAPAFPDFGQGRILACFAVPEFRMTFPPSQIREISPTRFSATPSIP